MCSWISNQGGIHVSLQTDYKWRLQRRPACRYVHLHWNSWILAHRYRSWCFWILAVLSQRPAWTSGLSCSDVRWLRWASWTCWSSTSSQSDTPGPPTSAVQKTKSSLNGSSSRCSLTTGVVLFFLQASVSCGISGGFRFLIFHSAFTQSLLHFVSYVHTREL